MNASTTPPRPRPPIAAIRLGGSERSGAETLYGTILVWFMRVLSALWIAQGLLHWCSVMLADDDGHGALETMSSFGMAAVVFFSVIDLVAAVGLWLAAAWGGVVWLVAVAAQWMAILILPRFFAYDVATGLLDLALVAAYVVLTFGAAREADGTAA